MKLFIKQTNDQVRKRRLAFVVTTVTSMIIASSMFFVSTLKTTDIFGASHPIDKVGIGIPRMLSDKN